MKFTAQEEYGLRCILQFARQGHFKADGRSMTIGDIAEIEGLTAQYAGKLIRILRMGGLLFSVRGRHGGYRLARPAEQISAGEVLAVLGGRVFEPDYCSRYTGDRKLCVHTVDCAIRSLWGALQEALDRILLRITLKDLMGSEKEVSLLGSSVHTLGPKEDGPKPEAPALVTISELMSSIPARKETP